MGEEQISLTGPEHAPIPAVYYLYYTVCFAAGAVGARALFPSQPTQLNSPPTGKPPPFLQLFFFSYLSINYLLYLQNSLLDKTLLLYPFQSHYVKSIM